MIARLASLLCCCALALATGSRAEPGREDGGPHVRPLRVVASFGPLFDFARRIGAADAVVACPVPGGADPAFWIPQRGDVHVLHDADLILVNGAGFERWTRVVSLPLSRVVDTTRAFRHELLTDADAAAHRHGPAGAHAHGGVNPHTWLDPEWARRQAQAVRDAFGRARPARKAAFEARCDELLAELAELHVAWSRLGRLADGEALVASHPSYDYLGARYGWALLNVHLDPERAPSDAELAALERALAGHTARTVLFESEPLPELVRALFERFGLRSVVVAPCEAVDETSYVARMRANVDRLAPAFGAR